MSDLPADVVRLLDAPSTAHLATLLPDGAPHCVPVWVGLEGDHVAFLTSPRTRKARNVARDPRVAISLTARDEPNDMAYLRGRVVERVDGDRAWTIIDGLSDKYIGMPYAPREDRAVYLIAVDHAGTFSP